MTTLPPSIRLGGRQWVLVPSTLGDDEGNAGSCSQRDRRITVATDQDPQDVVDTVIHEAFHAILYTQGREHGGPTEERYVRALATGFTNLLQEDPNLLAWISQTLHPHDSPRKP